MNHRSKPPAANGRQDMGRNSSVRFERGTTKKARELTLEWILQWLPEYSEVIATGLPEYDDRTDQWRVALKSIGTEKAFLGDVKFDRFVKKVTDHTNVDLINERIEKLSEQVLGRPVSSKTSTRFYPTPVPNKVVLGDCVKVLEDFPADSAQLVFTSPPYFNAKTEYSEYVDYQEYLDFLRRVIVRCHHILSEGRFFVINVSPVLIKRTSRNSSSRRIPIPFDVHRILDAAGFEFIDDIIWVKPEGAGWNAGRGRRFAADRQPLQYKAVPVTEYVLVYRKKTDRLIDWNIRNHHDPTLVKNAKILGEYDRSNVWRIHPSHSKDHPATFPEELVEKVIRYYSFEDDLVLDPFAGSGTVGKVAFQMKRRFILIEKELEYFRTICDSLAKIIPERDRVDFDVYQSFGD